MAGKKRRSEADMGTKRRNSANSRSERNVKRKRSVARKSRKNQSAVRGSHGRKKKKAPMSLGMKIALGVCSVLLIVIVVVIAVLASKMSKLGLTNLDPDKLSISDELEYDEKGYLNVALFGLDTRAKDKEMGSRSDTIMIASLNRETKEVKLVSVYRDTLLQQDDGSYNKANAAYSFGQAEEAIAMLNRNLDMNIRHYVTVDFSALVDVIDALDGIEIDVTEEEIPYINGYAVEIIKNTGVDTWAVTQPGLQILTGVQATAYARIRYTAGDDFKRAERQRTVLTKIAEKAQGVKLSTLNKIIDRVFPKVETNFTMAEMLAYAKDVKKYKLCETTGFPEDRDGMIYGDVGDVVLPYTLEDNVIALHKYLFGEDGYTPTSTVKSISEEISYLSGQGGTSGYGQYETGNYTDTEGYSTYQEPSTEWNNTDVPSDTGGYTEPPETPENPSDIGEENPDITPDPGNPDDSESDYGNQDGYVESGGN